MNSGKYNTPVELYVVEIVEDHLGLTEEVEKTICSDKACVEHIKSSERFENNRLVYNIRKKVTMRKRRDVAFDNEVFMRIKGKKFNIIDVDDSSSLTIIFYVEEVK